jgi:hypothetical protein
MPLNTAVRHLEAFFVLPLCKGVSVTESLPGAGLFGLQRREPVIA